MTTLCSPTAALLVVAVALFCVDSTSAAEPQFEFNRPIPRVASDEARNHNAPITSIDSDSEGTFLVTGSHDKTIRIWPFGPLDGIGTAVVLRVPLVDAAGQHADVGTVNAVAISPDANVIAAGGIFSPSRTEKIFLFDRLTGRVRPRVLTGLNSAVLQVKFSKDSRFLAAGSAARGPHGRGCVERGAAVRVWDLQSDSGEPSFVDETFKGDVAAIGFGPNGDLVAGSNDGSLRIYRRGATGNFDAVETLSARLTDGFDAPDLRDLRYTPQKLTLSIRGDLAIAYLPNPYDCASRPPGERNKKIEAYVAVVDHQGSWIIKPKPVPASISAMTWSNDGTSLFVAGLGNDPFLTRISRDSGAAAVISMPNWNAADRILALTAVPDGVAVATAEPRLFVLRQDNGSVMLSRRDATPLLVDHSHIDPRWKNACDDDFRVSRGGTVLELPDTRGRTYRIDIARGMVDVSSKHDPLLKGPLLASDAVRILIDNKPRCGHSGREIGPFNLEIQQLRPIKRTASVKFPDGEYIRSTAIDEVERQIAIGSEWALGVYDFGGRLVWKTEVSSPVWRVNFSADGRFIIAAFGEGIVRWFDRRGTELLALYVDVERTEAGAPPEWVVWTPSANFDSSERGAKLGGWHINLEPAPETAFYPFHIFRKLRREHLGRDVLLGGKIPKPSNIQRYLPPIVRIKRITDLPNGAKLLDLDVIGPNRGEVHNFYGVEDNVLKHKEGFVVPEQITIDNSVSMVVFEATILVDGEEYGAPMKLRATSHSEPSSRKGRLFALLLGVSDYKDKRLQLSGAERDAQDLEMVLRRQSIAYPGGDPKIFRLPEGSSSEQIRKEFNKFADTLKSATDNDVAMIFLSGHGLTVSKEASDRLGRKSRYFFLPRDVVFPPEFVGGDVAIDASELPLDSLKAALSGDDLMDLLGRITQMKVVFLDTCYAGSITNVRFLLNNPQLFSEIDQGAHPPIFFSSSTGHMRSYECPEPDGSFRGCFTKAILQKLLVRQGEQGKLVTAEELAQFVRKDVQERTSGRTPPQKPYVPNLRGDDPVILNQVSP